MSRNFSALMPASVTVVFPGRRCSGNPGDCAPDYKSVVAIADINFNVPGVPSGLTGAPGTSHVIFDTAVALYEEDETVPFNQETLDDLAFQIASDFYNWRSIYIDQTYQGVIEPKVNGLTDLIEWNYTHTEQWTRVQTKPWDGEPTEFSHQDPEIQDCPRTAARQLVLIPPLKRDGNHLLAGKAWLSLGECNPSHYPPIYSLIFSTTSDERVFICCTSGSSSTSTTSEFCPVKCPECNPVGAFCTFHFSCLVDREDFVTPVPTCTCMTGDYFATIVGHCTWVAKFGSDQIDPGRACGPGGTILPNGENTVTFVVTFSGGRFQATMMDIVGHHLEFAQPPRFTFDCVSATGDFLYVLGSQGSPPCASPDYSSVGGSNLPGCTFEGGT